MTDKNPDANEASARFETLLQSLDETVASLESGDMPLEESLKLFEKGIITGRKCEEILNLAEKRIETLLQNAEKENSA